MSVARRASSNRFSRPPRRRRNGPGGWPIVFGIVLVAIVTLAIISALQRGIVGVPQLDDGQASAPGALVIPTAIIAPLSRVDSGAAAPDVQSAPQAPAVQQPAPVAPAVVQPVPALAPPVQPTTAFVVQDVPAGGGGSSGFGGAEDTAPQVQQVQAQQAQATAPVIEPTAIVLPPTAIPWSSGDNGTAGQWSGGSQGSMNVVDAVPTAAPEPESGGGGGSGFD